MTYEEVQEILSSKKNIPYPKLMNVRQNPKYADLLYESYAGSSRRTNSYYTVYL